jgi:hypothetical protein
VILAIDPGPTESAFVLYDPATRRVADFGKWNNPALLSAVMCRKLDDVDLSMLRGASFMVVEMIASYGMPVGREVFETCMWIGRFVQAWNSPHDLMYRSTVKLHLCNSARAKDANVRAALIDAFGGKEKAMGSKRQPGPLYGVSGDVWAALGVAVTYADIQEQARSERLHEVVRHDAGDYTIAEQTA